MLAGCAENPGTWGEDKVKAKIIEKLELEDVTLTANPEGGYTGKGMRDGETFTVKITQDPAAHRLSWDAESDRGSFEDGFFELK